MGESYKFYEKDRVDQMKMSMSVLGDLIKMNEGDLLNDNPHELTLIVGYEMASLISAMMIRPILEVLGTKE